MQRVPVVAVAVAIHTAIAIVHGAAHAALGILPPPLDAVFILAAVYVLPVASVLLIPRDPRAWWVLAIALGAAFAYGAASHFVLSGVDNAVRLPAGGWSAVFLATTVGLAIFEALGVALGIRHLTAKVPSR